MSRFFSYLSWFQIVLLMVGLMSGILSLFREVILIKNPEKAKDHYLFWRCTFIAFIISSAVLWVTEHSIVLEQQARLDELTKPGFVVETDTEASACHLNDTLTLLGVRVSNNGADSAVLDYEAYYESKTIPKQRVDLVVLGLAGSLDLKFPDGQTYRFTPSHFLYSKTNVIHRGDFIVGKLPLQLPGDRCKDLTDPSTKITIKAKDYTGHWATGYYEGKPEKPNAGPDMMQGENTPMLVQPDQKK
jgi:hypothetical protein